MSDSNLQYVTSTTFLLFTYAKYLSVSNQVVRCGNIIATPTRIRTLAKRQVQKLTTAFLCLWGADGAFRRTRDRYLLNYISLQVDYILGDNPLGMSYMVGYGAKFPERIHHRGSSLRSIYNHPQKISCNDGF